MVKACLRAEHQQERGAAWGARREGARQGRGDLLVHHGVPIAVEDDDRVGCREIDPDASSLGAEQEHKLRRAWGTETVDSLLPLDALDVSIDALVLELAIPEHIFDHVEDAGHLREDEYAVAVPLELGQKFVEECEFGRRFN